MREFLIKDHFMDLNMDDYRDRVYACWLGKNIGGTMGAPYEMQRKTHDIQGFTTAPGTPLPNDDLDLQMIWLHAVETVGPLAINAATLGEFWISQIPASWNEYAYCKNNMHRGLVPPISGDYDNMWKDSNGAWIRTEIWACLAPGCPDLAAKYAMEDAKVDHGAAEGTVAAAFVAAMQSAAFVVKDLRKCIQIGLAAIPEDSRMADSVRFVLECYDKGMMPLDARNAVQQRNADVGEGAFAGWFQAPSNVAYAVIGLLWGEGDFKKSLITAINCGDDTDCTGATVGATLGILGGTKSVPADWQEYIGDAIITIALNKGDHLTGGGVPKSCTELTQRVVKQAPFVLHANHAYAALHSGESNIPEDVEDKLVAKCEKFRNKTVLKPFTAHYEMPFLSADVTLSGGPDITPLEEKRVSLVISCNRVMGDDLVNLTCRWWLADGFAVSGRKTAFIAPDDRGGVVPMEFTLAAGERVEPVNRCVLEIVPEGRSVPLYIPIVLLG